MIVMKRIGRFEIDSGNGWAHLKLHYNEGTQVQFNLAESDLRDLAYVAECLLRDADKAGERP